MDNRELELLGISVEYLSTTFLEEVKSADFDETAAIYDIEEKIILKKGHDVQCPVDKRTGASYVHSIVGDNCVGRATLMLSYTWGYAVGDIVDTLVHHCKAKELDTTSTYVWICCLCINQHRVKENAACGVNIPFEEFYAVFNSKVNSIGHILAMMAPWHSPAYLDRVWCVFEMFTANKNNLDITIGMPMRERTMFVDGLRAGDFDAQLDKFFSMLGTVDVRNAKASVNSDLITILKLIENDVGYETFNKTVCRLLREWAFSVIESAVEDGGALDNDDYKNTNSFCCFVRKDVSKKKEHAERQGDLLNNVGVFFHRIGENDRALVLLKEALRLNKSVLGWEHYLTGVSFLAIGYVLYEKGKFQEALKSQREALAIQEKVFGRNHGATANTIGWISRIMNAYGDVDGALKMGMDGLEIRENLVGRVHRDTANSLAEIALILKKKGDVNEALEMQREVVETHEIVFGKAHTETAMSMYQLGVTLEEKGEKEKARTMYQNALVIQENVYGSEHPHAVQTRERCEWIALKNG